MNRLRITIAIWLVERIGSNRITVIGTLNEAIYMLRRAKERV